MKTILEKIRKIRLEKEYSQEYMAMKLKIDYSTYGKTERGIIVLSLERFIKICEVLETDPADLLGESIYKKKNKNNGE
jgi:transcriptional regulator with XRE-family HTH domain